MRLLPDQAAATQAQAIRSNPRADYGAKNKAKYPESPLMDWTLRGVRTLNGCLGHVVSWVVLAFLYFYRWILSPFLVVVNALTGGCAAAGCRYHPTCSAFALHVFRRYSPLWAAYYTLRRLLSCHPWHVRGLQLTGLQWLAKLMGALALGLLALKVLAK